jgi:PAS domain S-box-containing protein
MTKKRANSTSPERSAPHSTPEASWTPPFRFWLPEQNAVVHADPSSSGEYRSTPRLWWSNPSAISRYAIAALSVAIALVAGHQAAIFLHTEPLVSLFLCAIIFASWFGGFGPGLFATALALLAFHYYLVAPIETYTVKFSSFAVEIKELPRIVLFAIAALFTSLLSSAQRSAAESLRRSRDDLLAAIEDQRRTEGALRQSEMYLAEAQRLSQSGSFGWDVAGGEIFWSEETFRIFGYDKAASATLDMVLQRVHPEDLALVQGILDRATGDGQNFDFEHRFLMPDGSVKHVHFVAHALSDEAGRTRFVGAVMDVTAAKEAKNKIQLIIDTVPALIWTAKPDGSLDFISQRLLDYQGVTREQKLGPGWGAQIHPDERDQIRSKWRAAVAEGKPFEAETRLRRFDGEYRWFLYRAFPLFDSSGRNLGWYGNDIDIHDRKQAEEALRQAQTDLARVNRVTTMGELTASLAHEVNQPIGAAVTNAESCLSWLAGDTPNLEEARAAASSIVKDGMRAAEIFSRIRLMFKKDTSRQELIDIGEVIREMNVLLRSEATRYFVSIRTEPAADLPRVMGDRVQLQQVIMNLMMNSIDAMKDVEGTRDLTIKSERAENGRVIVSVSDTGVGLPPRQADRIFDAFFTTKLHGTGMGLSISRSIVEAHGGRLWAADNSPRGASFHLTLPAKVEAHR